jgi:hypothetical protein
MTQPFAHKEIPFAFTEHLSARASDCSRCGEILNLAGVMRVVWEENGAAIENGLWLVQTTFVCMK